jgi:hypothetical protein
MGLSRSPKGKVAQTVDSLVPLEMQCNPKFLTVASPTWYSSFPVMLLIEFAILLPKDLEISL